MHTPQAFSDRRGFLAGATMAALSALVARPVMAATTLPALKDLMGDPDVYDVALSPDGLTVAMLMRSDGKKIVVKHTLADKTSRRLIVGDFDVLSLNWASRHHVMATIRRTTQSGTGLYSDIDQTLILDTDSGKNFLLYERQNGYSTAGATAFRVRNGSDYALISKNYQYTRIAGPVTLESISNGGLTQNVSDYSHLVINRVDPVSGLLSQLDRSEWGENWAVSGDGRAVARADYIFTSGIWSVRFNINGDWKEVFSQKVPVLNVPRLLGLSRDGQGVMIDLGEDPNGEAESRWIELRPDGTQSPFALNGHNPSMVLHPATRQLAGIRYDEDTTRYDFFDPVLQKVAANAAKAMTGYRYRIVDWAEDPRKLLLYVEGTDDAGTYYFADFTTANVVALGAAYPRLPVAAIREKQSLSVTASDGLTLEAYLTRPADREGPVAAVVLPHGGPESRDDLWGDPLITTLTSRGYAVLQVNYRGSSGYGMGFVRKGYGEWGRGIPSDIADAVRQAGAQGLIDPKRVAILGIGRFAGYLAMMGPALESALYKCAVSISGFYDLEDWRNSVDIRSGGRERYSGQYLRRSTGEATDLKAISPAQMAGRLQCPVMLMQLEKDSQVPPSQLKSMEKALKAAGKPCEVVKIRNQDRLWLNEAARLETADTLLRFLQQHNPA